MNITVNTEALTAALKPLARIAAGRSSLPIFTSVLIEADGKRKTVTITATDGEQILAITVPADAVEQPGNVCVSASMLMNMLNGETGDTSLVLDTGTKKEDTRLLVKTPGLSTRLAVIAASEFPPHQKEDPNTAVVTVSATDLAERIAAIRHGASTDETRYILNGVALVFKTGASEIACGDGRRMAFAPIEAKIEGSDVTVPLHTKSVGTIVRLLDGLQGDVQLHINGNRLHIDLGGEIRTEYTCKLIEGTYPNYQQVIPAEESLEHSMGFDTQAFKAALHKCTPIAALCVFPGTVTIAPEGLTATVSAENPSAGSVKIDVPCKTEGTPSAFSINAAYLLQILANDTRDETIIRHQDAISPQVVTGRLGKHIVMPITSK